MTQPPQENPQSPAGAEMQDEPRIYALKREGSRWTTTRRGFIAAAATAAGVAGPARGQQLTAAEDTECGVGFSHATTVNGLAITPDGKLLASCGDRTAKLWSLPDGGHLKTLPIHPGGVFAVATNQSGDLLASTGQWHSIALWTLPEGELRNSVGGTIPADLVQSINTRAIVSVAITPDGKLLAEGSSNTKDIRLWSVPELEHVRTVRTLPFEPLWQLAISPDGNLLAAATDMGNVRVWSLPDGSEVMTRDVVVTIAYAVAFSPDGKVLASGDIASSIKLWSMPDGELLKEFRGHTVDRNPASVRALAFSPDGKLLASGGEGPTIKLWLLPDCMLIGELTGHGDQVSALTFSPDGTLLASGGSDQIVRLWSMPDGALRRCLVDPAVDRCEKVYAHWSPLSSEVCALAINLDATLLASASRDETMKLWSLPEGAHVKTFAAEPAPPRWGVTGATHIAWCLAMTPDGQLLASGHVDGRIILWSLPECELRVTLDGHQGLVSRVAVSADGKLLISGAGDGTIRLWSLPEGLLLKTLEGYPGQGGLAISPKGDLLLAASAGDAIRAWKLPDGEMIGTVKGHTQLVKDLAISQDGKLFASAGGLDWTLALWSLPEGRPLRTLKSKHVGSVDSVALTPDGQLLAAGRASEKTGSVDARGAQLELWSTQSGALLKVLRGHEGAIGVLVITPDGSTLISGDYAGRIRLWSLPEGETVACLMDVGATPASSKAIQYKVQGVGETRAEVTYTLPAGSPMPPGAVCTCNVVAGSGRGGGGGGHYWHPN